MNDGGGGSGVAALAVLILLPLGLLNMFAPKQVWWALTAWKYKNPDANEPSEGGYMMARVGGAFMVLLSIIAIAAAANS